MEKRRAIRPEWYRIGDYQYHCISFSRRSLTDFYLQSPGKHDHTYLAFAGPICRSMLTQTKESNRACPAAILHKLGNRFKMDTSPLYSNHLLGCGLLFSVAHKSPGISPESKQRLTSVFALAFVLASAHISSQSLPSTSWLRQLR